MMQSRTERQRRLIKLAGAVAILFLLILIMELGFYFYPPATVRLGPLRDGYRAFQPLPGEPESWDDFLDWAEAELLREPAPAPLPEATLASPGFPLIRLTERLEKETAEFSNQTQNESAKVLAQLGPFKSDSAQEGFTVQHKDSPGGPLLKLQLTGLELNRLDVKKIEIEIRQTTGEYFDLVWGTNTWGPVAERARIPVPDNEKFWPLSIRTKGFANWSGSLQELSLEVPAAKGAEVEIRSIRFLGPEPEFPEPVGVKRLSMAHKNRTVLYSHCPAEVRFKDISIPEKGRFQAGVEIHSKSTKPISAIFELWIEDETGSKKVFEKQKDRDWSWKDVRCDLEPWAGKTVDLILKATSDSGQECVATWSNPIVYQAQEQAPIVFLYLVDALSAQHINLYGYARETMPRLTDLAKSGTWFDPMFANSTLTYESVPSILFSLPFDRFSSFYNSQKVSSELISFAESLQSAGVATALFSTNGKAGPAMDTDQGFDLASVNNPREELAIRTVPTDEIMDWLKSHSDRPTFVYIHTMEPHGPYCPPDKFLGHFAPVTYKDLWRNEDVQSDDHLNHLKDRYDEEVLFADEQLGLFMDRLKEDGYADRSSILFTADHGEAFGEHGAEAHGSVLFGEVHRIPLVAFGSMVKANGKQTIPAQLFDIAPTVLDLFDLPAPYTLAGDSLVPILSDSQSDFSDAMQVLKERPIFGSNHSLSDRSGVVEYTIVEKGRWKLIVRCRGKPDQHDGWPRYQFFDLEKDPFEKYNRIPLEYGMRSIARKLLMREKLVVSPRDKWLIRRMLRKLVHWRWQQQPIGKSGGGQALSFDGDELRELRHLGYIK